MQEARRPPFPGLLLPHQSFSSELWESGPQLEGCPSASNHDRDGKAPPSP